MSRRASNAFAWLITLIFMAWWVGSRLPAFEPVPGPWLPEAARSLAPEAWQLSGDLSSSRVVQSDELVLSREQRGHLYAEQLLALNPAERDAPVWLQLQGNFSLRDVTVGDKYWHTAMVTVRLVDALGEQLPGVRNLLIASGTQTHVLASQVLEVPQQAASVQLLVRLIDASGELQVHGLALQPVQPSSLFAWARLAVFVAWGLVLGLLAWVWRPQRWSAGLFAGTGLTVAVLVGISAPVAWMPIVVLPVEHLFAWLLADSGYRISPQIIPKIGHAVIFALLGALLGLRLWRSLTLRHGLILLLLLALGTEALQGFLPGRNPRLTDLAIDMGGVLVGVALGWLIGRSARWLRARRLRRLPG